MINEKYLASWEIEKIINSKDDCFKQFNNAFLKSPFQFPAINEVCFSTSFSRCFRIDKDEQSNS